MSVPGNPGERITGCLELPGASCSYDAVLVLRRGGRLFERPPLVSDPLLSRPEDTSAADELYPCSSLGARCL
jgi:hypothetical protein